MDGSSSCLSIIDMFANCKFKSLAHGAGARDLESRLCHACGERPADVPRFTVTHLQVKRNVEPIQNICFLRGEP